MALSLTATERPVAPCPGGAAPFAHAVWQSASLAGDGSPRALSLPGDDSPERQILPVASLDDRLFVRVAQLLDPCSDPPRYRLSAVEISLASGSSVVVVADESSGAAAVHRELERVRAAVVTALAAVPRGHLPDGFAPEGGGLQE